jgi:hypothetical protein
MGAEAEVVMVVDAGRFHHQLEVLAADSTRCRPLRFRSRGRTAGRRKPYAICEVFQDASKPGDQDFRDAIVPGPRAGTVCGASNCFRVRRRGVHRNESLREMCQVEPATPVVLFEQTAQGST